MIYKNILIYKNYTLTEIKKKWKQNNSSFINSKSNTLLAIYITVYILDLGTMFRKYTVTM